MFGNSKRKFYLSFGLSLIVGLFFLSTASAEPAQLEPLETTNVHKNLKNIVQTINKNPAKYRKNHPKGYRATVKNLNSRLIAAKKGVWNRLDRRKENNVAQVKNIYSKLIKTETARYQATLNSLTPLMNKSDRLIKKVASLPGSNCRFLKKHRRYKNKRKRKRVFKRQKRAYLKCNERVKLQVKKTRKTLTKVNSQLEPQKQANLAKNIKNLEGASQAAKAYQVAFDNISNNSTLQELHTLTKLANKGRRLIGARVLAMPNPKMSSSYSAQTEFWGMMHAGNFDANRAAAAGVGTVRINLFWCHIRQAPAGKYNWGAQDAEIKKAALAGIRTTLTLYSDKNCGPNAPRAGSTEFKAYMKMITATVKRYGVNGSFWKTNKTVPYLPVTMWNVWNEPNFAMNSPGGKKVNPSQYAKLLTAASRRIHKVNRAAIVSIGGLANSKSIKYPQGIPGNKFLRKMYNYPEVRASFDAVSFHPYSATVAKMASSVKEIRLIMNRNGDSKKPLYITEVGWATGGPRGALVVSENQQAENLTAAMNWFKKNAQQLNIPLVNWYFWKDISGATYGKTKNWDSYAGLIDINGRLKKAFSAFIEVTGGH